MFIPLFEKPRRESQTRIATMEISEGRKAMGKGVTPDEEDRRILRESKMMLERLAANEPAPTGTTYQEWAKELLA